VFDNTGVGIRFKTRRPRGGGGDNLIYERIRMNLTGAAFNWDMLGSSMYVGDLAKRLPVREINRLTPSYKNIVARDFIVENASQFVKLTGIPETPLTNLLIENADIKTKRLFSASDANGITLRNVRIQSEDSLINLLDARHLLFENVQFTVPGNNIVTKIAGDLSDDIIFKNCQPQKPKGWEKESWNK
jgi:hypothetical protein